MVLWCLRDRKDRTSKVLISAPAVGLEGVEEELEFQGLATEPKKRGRCKGTQNVLGGTNGFCLRGPRRQHTLPLENLGGGKTGGGWGFSGSART